MLIKLVMLRMNLARDYRVSWYKLYHNILDFLFYLFQSIVLTKERCVFLITCSKAIIRKWTMTLRTRGNEMRFARGSRQPRRNGSIPRFSKFSGVKRNFIIVKRFWAWENREPCAKRSLLRWYLLHSRLPPCVLLYTYMCVFLRIKYLSAWNT